MHSLISLAFVALDMSGTLRTVGLLGGIALLVIWVLSIKSTTALFHDPKKIRATIMFAVPGLILLAIGVVMFMSIAPMRSHIYIANYSTKDGRLVVGDNEYTVASGSWEKFELRVKEESYPVKGFLGDSMVFDTTMMEGSYIGSFSDDKIVVAEEVEYAANSFGSSPDDLDYEILMEPGIRQFSGKIISDLYDFDKSSPSSMKVSSSSSKVRKYDLQLMSQAEMFKMMLEAMGEEDGEGSGLDSLLEGLGDEDGEDDMED
jgi:hypothetical protein